MQPLLTAVDVSQALGVTTGQLAQWRHLGRGPRFIKQGRFVRYRPADIDAWLDAQTFDRTDRKAQAS